VDGNFDYVDKCFARYDEQALIGLKQSHTGLVREGKRQNAFVVFDNCINPKQWNSEALTSLLMQVRYYGITAIISVQYLQYIPPKIRSNVFQVAMFYMQAHHWNLSWTSHYVLVQMLDNEWDFKHPDDQHR